MELIYLFIFIYNEKYVIFGNSCGFIWYFCVRCNGIVLLFEIKDVWFVSIKFKEYIVIVDVDFGC